MLEQFINKQPIASKILINSVKKNRNSHAYLFETNGCSYANKYILSFVKFLLCPNNKINNSNCENCNICNTIDQGNYPELKIIEPDGQWIKKEQLIELQQEFNKKAIVGNKKIYIINGADKLNPSSANSILKFLEEPEENIIAILVVDNRYQVMETILSRCQIISLQKENKINNSDELTILASTIYKNDNDINEFINDEKNSELLENAINFINYYEEHHLETLIYINNLWNKTFNKKTKDEDKEESEDNLLNAKQKITPFEIGINVLILYYKDIINFKTNRKLETFFTRENTIKKIANNNTVENLCNKLKICIKTKNKIKLNLNKNLLMDKLIFELEEVK